MPGDVRSDNGPEFVAKAVRKWIAAVGAKTAFIEPGSPWENGYCESFNAKLRDALLDGEIVYSLVEAKTVVESARQHYDTRRPHSSLGCKPPAAEAIVPVSNMAVRPTVHEIEAGQLNRGRPVDGRLGAAMSELNAGGGAMACSRSVRWRNGAIC